MEKSRSNLGPSLPQDVSSIVQHMVTDTLAKGTIKWMKGALIGAGSFGKVYLAMDSQSGLLMAVKQVELLKSVEDGPMGTDVKGEVKDTTQGLADRADVTLVDKAEVKSDTKQALDREIELLKDLQHPNIVQYLGRSSRQIKH